MLDKHVHIHSMSLGVQLTILLDEHEHIHSLSSAGPADDLLAPLSVMRAFGRRSCRTRSFLQESLARGLCLSKERMVTWKR